MRIALACVLVLVATKAFAGDFPEGWRLPTEKELAGEERDNKHNAYSSENIFSKATGDFNGDGKVDSAYILVSERFNGDGLFLRLSSPEGYRWITLVEDNWDKAYPGKRYKYDYPNMGIGTLPPKLFREYVERARITPTDIVPNEEDFENPALDYFRFESAGSLFFWSKREQRFVRFWYSD